MVARLRLAAAVSVLCAGLAFSALGVFSASASAKPRGKVVSAKLTPKSSFTTAQATTVKLVCKFSPASKRAVFLLSKKTNAKWVKLRSITKKGSIKTYTTTVKKLFGSKAVTAGQYRTKVSADANSLTRTFIVTEPASSDESGDNGSGSTTGSRSRGGGDCGEDCGDNSGDDSGDDNGGSSGTPGTFSKTSPANGATGQPTSLTLSWSVSSGADHYEYCVDTTNNSKSGNSCSATSPSKGWATASSTTAKVGGLQSGKTYYWQVRAVVMSDDTSDDTSGETFAYAGRAWFSFTVA